MEYLRGHLLKRHSGTKNCRQLNLLIQSLPPDSKATLLKACEAVELPLHLELFHSSCPPRYVHFLTSGLASTSVSLRSGAGVEVGHTGREGIAEKICLLGPARTEATRCVMQVRGTGLRMSYKAFRSLMSSDPALLHAVYRCIQQDMLSTMQLVACNRRHDVGERLARWILLAQDRLESNSIEISQERLAEALGTVRQRVNAELQLLEQNSAIFSAREMICVTDRKRLETASCECYGVITRLCWNAYQRTPQGQEG